MAGLLRANPSVIRELHRRVLRLVADAQREYGDLGLRLEGGTALAAYYLHHRESEDLDLFGRPGMDARDFARFVEERAAEAEISVVRTGPATRGFSELVVQDAAGKGRPLRIQLGIQSPYTLDPAQATEEGVPVASYRDLCAGKLHAICDRFEPRDFVDLHAILHRPQTGSAQPPSEGERRRRIRHLVADLQAIDPGLTTPRIGEAVARGLKVDLVSGFPLRLLSDVTDSEVRATVELCCDEIAAMVAEGWDLSRT
ncbi:hypothetical protein HRbin33_00110 [bacterium HR33]|nr:hypothetical protein HRbin33_00110 [bacterium HR33]